MCVLRCIFQKRLDMSFILRRGPSMQAKGTGGERGWRVRLASVQRASELRGVSMKLSFKAHLRGCFLPSRCDPLCFGRIQNAPQSHCDCTHAWWDALLTTASRGHSVQGNDSERGRRQSCFFVHFLRKDNVCASQCCLSTSDQFP